MSMNKVPQVTRPGDEKQLAEFISKAAIDSTPLEISCGESKSTMGRAMQTAATVSLQSLKGIVDYQPTELVITRTRRHTTR